MILYEPSKVLKKLAPKSKIKKILSDEVTLKRSALKFVDATDAISKKSVVTVALKAIKNYKERIEKNPEIKDAILKDPALLIQRVQNEVIGQVVEEIKTKYNGEFYVWLPSEADEPDPEHQLNYGKTFQIGDGEMPGDRYGCQCGMEILTEDTVLEL